MNIRSMMPRLVTTVVMITLSFSLYAGELEPSIKEIAKELATQMKEKAAKKIAVVSFSDLNGFESALSSFISEELITALFSEGKFDVVERRELDRVLQEQQKYTQNIFDKETVAELQRLLGIDAIITGSITDLGERIKLNTRAISVETGKVFAASSASIDKDQVIKNLLLQSSASTGASGQTAKSGLVTQPSDVYFKNAFIHVVPTSLLKQENGIIRVTTEFRNITHEPLRVGLRVFQGDLFAATRSGDTFSRINVSGIFQDNSVKPCETRPENRTVIAPNSKALVIWDLITKGNLNGQFLTLRGVFCRVAGKKQERFTVQLNGLRLN